MKTALWALMAAALLAPPLAHSQSVTLQGVLGSKALLIIDGAPPRTVSAGDTLGGVKVLTVAGDQATVEIGGKRHTLRVGDAQVNIGGKAVQGGNRIVLHASDGGHFMAQGSINGRATRFMVDTGASAVSMGASEAQRLGVDFSKGQQVRMSTANGVAPGWLIKLRSVRINDVEVFEVDAVVSQQPMPFILLGNSFLTRFQMRRENDQMVLERRY